VELNKTRCLDCHHVNRWYSYKWASTPERQEHNRKNRTTCPKCESTNVKDFDDDETMAPYRFAADVILDIAKKKRDDGDRD
jgi:Zn finger protein HypA/HybF involved in hydrogenase expression